MSAVTRQRLVEELDRLLMDRFGLVTDEAHLGDVADEVLALLAEPTGQGNTRTEWALRRAHGRGFTIPTPHEQVARREQRENFPGTTVVRRQVTTGPWVEAPDPSP